MRSAESGQSVAMWSGRLSSMRVEHLAGDLHRFLVKAGLHSPGSVDARAGIDQLHLGAGGLQHETRRKARHSGAEGGRARDTRPGPSGFFEVALETCLRAPARRCIPSRRASPRTPAAPSSVPRSFGYSSFEQQRTGGARDDHRARRRRRRGEGRRRCARAFSRRDSRSPTSVYGIPQQRS